jgi:hypothetical protein
LPSSSFKVQTSVAQFFEHFRIKELAVPVLWGKKIQTPRIVGSGCLKNRWKVFMKEPTKNWWWFFDCNKKKFENRGYIPKITGYLNILRTGD